MKQTCNLFLTIHPTQCHSHWVQYYRIPIQVFLSLMCFKHNAQCFFYRNHFYWGYVLISDNFSKQMDYQERHDKSHKRQHRQDFHEIAPCLFYQEHAEGYQN